MIETYEDLFEFMAERINKANDSIPEAQRSELIIEAVVAAAEFILAVTPTTPAHRLALTSGFVRTVRGITSPFMILPREYGDETELCKAFDKFITDTDGWDATHH